MDESKKKYTTVSIHKGTPQNGYLEEIGKILKYTDSKVVDWMFLTYGPKAIADLKAQTLE